MEGFNPMKSYSFLLLIFFYSFCFSQNVVPTHHPIYGVYRGLSTPIQSCTVSILEQKAYETASVMIDQNPYLFISTTQLMGFISSHSLKVTLPSNDPNRPGNVVLFFNSKNALTDVFTTFNGATSHCSQIFQIKLQN